MRILGITIPDTKRLDIALTVLYGVGRSRAQTILKQAKIDPTIKSNDLSVDQENEIRKIIETFKIEGDLKREVASNIKRHKDIKTYRGSRHIRDFLHEDREQKQILELYEETSERPWDLDEKKEEKK